MINIRKNEFILLSLSLSTLIIGLVYYLQFRESTLFFEWVGIEKASGIVDVPAIFYAVPTFLHVFAFSILTWYLSGLQYPLSSILLWVGINLFFEFLQLLPHEIAQTLPFVLRDYVIKGTFDLYDVAAIFTASLFAYTLIRTRN